ncbi:C-type lectin domain family 10 member A-like isoform X2 [Conger conger]|uniref:C-type lectin domain family 10 member A-like isoform X2 n=1 Tax=Conger conger TaxID=82655 RepID=UPI002A5A4099|nr:C-type lectin domain family 10 member A-like isoform X2 [Conger conger]
MSKGLLYLPVKFKKNFCHDAAVDQAKQLDSAVSLEELKEAVACRKKVTQGEDVTNIDVKTNCTSLHTVSLCGPSETEKRGQSSHPYRLAAVCLGLLCALLLTATIVLCVLYMRAGEEGALRQNDTIEEGVAEQLRANCSIHTDDIGQQQENYNKMAEEKGLIQKNYNKMAEQKDKLQKNYDKMAEDKAQLQKRNKVLTEVNAQLQKNCSTVWTDYNTLDNDKRQLVTDYNVLAKEKIQRERDYSALETECQTLTREKKRVEEERKTLQQLLEEERDMFQRWNRTFMVVLENMKHKEQLQRDFDAVLAKSPFLDQYCPLSLQKRVCKPCPQGWEQFYSKCYYFSTERKSWMDGRSDCIKQGADLVVIKSEEEQEFITKYTRDYNWIGLSDSETEGTWLWVDGSPLQRGFWRNGQPDDHFWFDSRTQYQDADCVVTVPGESAWMDTHCYSYRRFICETDALLL